MASFSVPSLDDLHELLMADAQARFPGGDFSRYSDNWKRLRTVALAVTSAHAHIDIVDDNLLPDTATGDALDRVGKVFKVDRNDATVASREEALRVTGSTGSAYTSGDELTHTDGTTYKITESGTIPSAGFVDVDIESITTGSSAKKQAGETLTFTSPGAGINASAELQLDINQGGQDKEEDGPYRQRIIDRIAQPGMGGNAEDYRQWALEVDGIVDAYVYSGRNGDGTVDVVGLAGGTGSERDPTSAKVTELEDYLDTKRPVSVKQVRALAVTTSSQNVDAEIEPESDDYEFDWDDSTPLEVSSWTSSTKTLQFTTARPADMAIGDRVIVEAADGDGSQLTIESLSSTDAVVVDRDPGWTISGGENVYAGGPMVKGARQDIIDHIDSLGPARGTTAALQWIGTLATSNLYKILQLVEGALDSVLNTPSANVTPTDSPPAATTEIVVSGRVIVRRRW